MIYELSGREDWESGREHPNLQMFLLRLNMNLIAGLTAGKQEIYWWYFYINGVLYFSCCFLEYLAAHAIIDASNTFCNKYSLRVWIEVNIKIQFLIIHHSYYKVKTVYR